MYQRSSSLQFLGISNANGKAKLCLSGLNSGTSFLHVCECCFLAINRKFAINSKIVVKKTLDRRKSNKRKVETDQHGYLKPPLFADAPLRLRVIGPGQI